MSNDIDNDDNNDSDNEGDNNASKWKNKSKATGLAPSTKDIRPQHKVLLLAGPPGKSYHNW